MDADKRMSEAARAMGKKRWEGMTEAERKEFMENARAKIELTPAERSVIGRNAVNARWAKWRAEHPDKAGEGQSGTAESRKSAGRTKKAASPRKKTKP